MGILSRLQRRNKKARSRPVGLRSKPVQFEALERREMLSINLPIGGSAVVSLNTGTDSIDVTVGQTTVSFAETSGATITINGASGDETVTIEDLGTVFEGAVVFNGSTGDDVLFLNDSAGDDSVVANADTDVTTMTTPYYAVTANDVEEQHFYASGGDDAIQLRGTTGADYARCRPEKGINYFYSDTGNSDVFYFRAKFFEYVNVYGLSGDDTADMRDTAANDSFVMDPDEDEAILWIAQTLQRVRVKDFDTVNMALINGGDDEIEYEGIAGSDDVHLDGTIAQMWAGGYSSADYVYSLSGLTSDDELTIIGEGGTNRLDLDSPVYSVDTEYTWITSDWYD